MDTIKFANGEVHDCPFCAAIPGEAYVAIADSDFATVAAIFSDTTKTSRMEYGDLVLLDFTNLLSVNVQPYGIQAALRGGTVQKMNVE